MKKFFTRPLLAIALISVVFTSCSDDSKDHEIVAPAGKIICKVNGTSFEADGQAQLYGNEIAVAGVSGTESILVFVTKAAQVGSYEAKGAALGVTPDAAVQYSPDNQDVYNSVFAVNGEKVGTVTITEVDETNKTVSGKFSSKTYNLDGVVKEVMSGSFTKIPYVTTPHSTMTAKIDGEDFAASVAVGLTGLGEIVINGQTLNDSKIITLSFPDDIGTGTFAIGELGDNIYGTYTDTNVIFVSTSGTVTITKHDTSLHRIEGTFSFDVAPFIEEGDGHSITTGTFAFSY